MATGEFSVWLFLAAGDHAPSLQWVDAETAVRHAAACAATAADLGGEIARIVITDGGDNTAFEWTYGKGITFK